MPSGPPPRLDEADVADALRRASLQLCLPLRLRQLSGGYSWRTYRVEGADGSAVILRVAPRGGTLEPYDPRAEARAIEAVGRRVPAPRVLAVESGSRTLGAPYLIQSAVAGTVLRLSAVGDVAERRAYRTTFARTLSLIHRHGDASMLGNAPTVGEALHVELRRTAERYRRAARWPRLGFEVGLRWLLTRLPPLDEPPSYCHGDYRFGNLSWTGPGELGGVLDWERAWCGDPMADVAFSRLYSGWCAVDGEAVAEYEKAGRRVDHRRLEYLARFELVRSYTASMLGAQAVLEGRSGEPALLEIGLAGERGMAELVGWLNDGELLPLPASWAVPVVPERLPALAPQAVGKALQGLRSWTPPVEIAPGLRAALANSDDDAAWRQAFTLLAPLARTASAGAVPGLQALARSCAAPDFKQMVDW